MFLILRSSFPILSMSAPFSGRSRTAILCWRSWISSISVLGRKNICRSFVFPCAVCVSTWNNPYRDRPSFAPVFDLSGPWFMEFGWFSDPRICRDVNVSALTKSESLRVNISIDRTLNANSASGSLDRYSAAFLRCISPRTAPAQPTFDG